MRRLNSALALLALLAGAAHAAGSDQTLTVGRLLLHACGSGRWCGTLSRPLDPREPTGGALSVYFEYFPHSGRGPAQGTLVATEGGPGYPATDSREEYLSLFAPLRASRDVLIMDNRGTGHSGAIDCQPLQSAPGLTEEDVGACGRALGTSAQLYSTNLASDDLDALLEALGVARADLYGDSYGTYFAQVFALRHPQRLRSLVLDGAYPLAGNDYAWYPHYAPAMRDKFNLACERASACRALAGSSIEHIAPAVALLRAQPFQARGDLGGGRVRQFTADAALLATVMFSGAPAYASVRETDAAARALLAGDRLPLARLMAETRDGVDSRDATRSPVRFSSGLAAAVSCQDPPQVFDMNLPVPMRLDAREHAMAQRLASAPDAYAPFTLAEYRRMPLDYAFVDECVLWPAPAPGGAPLPLVRPDGPYPDLPVLVLSGELDNITTVAEGAEAAAHFARAHQVVLVNSFHVNALPHARSDCGAQLVRRFLADLSAGDESCARQIAPVPLVPRFARRAHELDPAQAATNNPAGEELLRGDADAELLRSVSAVLYTCADVIAHAPEAGEHGAGLRGGSFRVSKSGAAYRAELQEVLWTEDVPVSGYVTWRAHGGSVHCSTVVGRKDAHRGYLDIEWLEAVSGARARINGALDAHSVHAEAPAP
jgi:pimeloyl-ACP methyl ester carboxylesterase